MDFLTQKWKIWYNSLDVNHDGKISMEDVEESRKKFTDLHHLMGDKAKGVAVDMAEWWKVYIFRGKDCEISESDFVSDLTARYNKDKDAFQKEMTACFNMIFDVIDTNKDRSIELSEFIYAFKAFGHENEGVVRKAFDLLRANSELIPLQVVVDSWISFVTCEDSSKTDVVKQAFESM